MAQQQQLIHTIDFNQYLDGVHLQPLHSNPPSSIATPPSLRRHLPSHSSTPHHPSSPTTTPIPIDSFLHATINHPTPLTNHSLNKHSLMRTLNGTWFRSTPDSPLPNAMTSSLAVRKQRTSHKFKDKVPNSTEAAQFSKQYQQPGIFPSRSARKMLRKPSSPHQQQYHSHRMPHEEGHLKMKIIKTVTEENKLNQPRPAAKGGAKSSRHSSTAAVRTRQQPIMDMFSNTGILGAGDYRPMIKGTRMHLHD